VLKVHTRDGITARIDLTDEAQAKEWLQRLKDPDFQQSITGVTIAQRHTKKHRCPKCHKSAHIACAKCGRIDQSSNCTTGIQYSLTKPEGFERTFFHLEVVGSDPDAKIRGGEKIVCFAGEVAVTIMVHQAQPSMRATLSKPGRQRYNPYA